MSHRNDFDMAAELRERAKKRNVKETEHETPNRAKDDDFNVENEVQAVRRKRITAQIGGEKAAAKTDPKDWVKATDARLINISKTAALWPVKRQSSRRYRG